jgi:sulfoxide reductase heme-binding subunit YedZ
MPAAARVGTKALVWGACLYPLARLVQRALADELGANPIDLITDKLGDAALIILLSSLAVTPLRIVTGWSWPIRFRRLLGLFAFFYASLHLSVWIVLDHFFAFGRMLGDVMKRPYITVGVLTLATLLPLALTSTRGMIRRLGGRRWQLLHRLAYLAGALAVLHYLWLAKKGVPDPYVYAGVLALLMLVRLGDLARRRARALGAALVTGAGFARDPARKTDAPLM